MTYQYSRRQANNPQYTFGTGKVNVLGGYTSAIVLIGVALLIAFESITRIFKPQSIQFNQAIGVAVIGLAVNIISGLMLEDHHDHEHHHHDHNLRAAYLHVLADALTSIFAIAALLAGEFLGWIWLDPVMGLVGAVVITKWSLGLIKDTSLILLDGAVDKKIRAAIISKIEGSDSDTRIVDLHVWYVSENHLSAAISVVTHYPKAPEYYRNLLGNITSLRHVLIEVNECHDPVCVEA